MMYAKCKMALNNDLIDKVLFVQNEQKMGEIPLTSQFDLSFSGTKNFIVLTFFLQTFLSNFQLQHCAYLIIKVRTII